MSDVEKIKAAIEGLPDTDYVQLRQWFTKRDWDKWDAQIATDSESGKLDFLMTEASEAKKKGTLKEF